MKTDLCKLKLRGRNGYFVAITQLETRSMKKFNLLKCSRYGNDGYLVYDTKIHITFKDNIESEELLCSWDTDNDFISTEHRDLIENANYYKEKIN